MKEDLDDEDAGACSSGSTADSSHCNGNPRASRNAAEKHRRDNLNNQIQAMATLVPAVATGGSRKRDKISILRLAANYLRMNYTLGRPSGEFLPARFNEVDLEDRLIDNLAGNSSFLLVLTTGGKIIYVSRHVEKHLGHEQTDLMGESLFNYVYQDDMEELKRSLMPDTSCLPALVSSSDSVDDGSNSSDDSSTYQPDYRQFRPQRRIINVRLSTRTNSRREATHYEYVQLSGVLRLASERRMQEQANAGKTKKSNNPTSNDIIFVGTVMLLQRKSVCELPHLVHNKNEYFTRHLTDGRIIFCDHRISIVAGYMSHEVSGSSAFKFMHKDDVRWTIVALRHMYDHGTPYGSSCYRLKARTGDYIYLRTHGYLEYDEDTKAVLSFICINTLIPKEEGEELIKEMKKRFSAVINTARSIQGNDSGFDSDTDGTSTEEPQLEQAIHELVSDLPSTLNNEEPCPDQQYVKAIAYSHKLPPPMIQAKQAGVQDAENIYLGKGGKGGKGKGAAGKGSGKGKGKQSPPSTSAIADSPSDHSRRNGERVSAIGEKRIPELEDATSPAVAEQSTDPPADKVFVSPSSSEPENYSQPATVDEDLSTNATASTDSGVSMSYSLQNSVAVSYIQSSATFASNLQQVNLKRSYEDDDEQVANKKVAMESVTLQLVNVNDYEQIGGIAEIGEMGEIGFPAYIQVQGGSDLQEVPTFQQIDAGSIALASTGGSFIELQEYTGELDPSIQNNPEVIKLLTNLPQTISLEESQEDVNVCQYPTGDLRD